MEKDSGASQFVTVIPEPAPHQGRIEQHSNHSPLMRRMVSNYQLFCLVLLSLKTVTFLSG